jgi:hypothetical protein
MLHKVLSNDRRRGYLKRQLGGFLSVSLKAACRSVEGATPRKRLHKERRALAGLVDAYTPPPNLAE